jgi:hypothetical protein
MPPKSHKFYQELSSLLLITTLEMTCLFELLYDISVTNEEADFQGERGTILESRQVTKKGL